MTPATSTGAADAAARGQQQDRLAAERFVRQLYQDVHERAASDAEIAGWAEQLAAGLSQDALRQTFLASPEHQARRQRDAERTRLATTGLVDPAWYISHYPDVAAAGVDPLGHYSEHGWREDRQPNPYFEPLWYRATGTVPDDENPLLHYIRHGEGAGVAPSPQFDPAWYRKAYAIEPGMSALAHFLSHRHDNQVAPSRHLWSVAGLPEGEAAGPWDDRFLRFLRSPLAASALGADLPVLLTSGLFDANFYAMHSNDVLEAQIDPLLHFCEFGWHEGRQPNFYFNLAWYRTTNPEVERLEVNPLLHYLLVGEKAGRRPIVFFDPTWYRATYDIAPFTSPLAHYLANRRRQAFSPHPLFDPQWYIAHCGVTVHPRRDPFSHYLMTGMHHDVAPSAAFDPAVWRRRTSGRPSKRFRHLMTPEKDNPLVNYLLATYR